MRQTVAIPETDSHVDVAAWIEAGKDQYQSGETLTVVVAMRNPYRAPLTVCAPRGQNIMEVRVVLKGSRYGNPEDSKCFPTVNELAEYYTSNAKPSNWGWAVAWQPLPAQLSRLPRQVTIPAVNSRSPSWMGAEWTEVGRVEIPHDEVRTWEIGNYGFSWESDAKLECHVFIVGAQIAGGWRLIRHERPSLGETPEEWRRRVGRNTAPR